MVVPSSTPKEVNQIWKRVNTMATAAASGLRDSLVNIETSCSEYLHSLNDSTFNLAESYDSANTF